MTDDEYDVALDAEVADIRALCPSMPDDEVLSRAKTAVDTRRRQRELNPNGEPDEVVQARLEQRIAQKERQIRAVTAAYWRGELERRIEMARVRAEMRKTQAERDALQAQYDVAHAEYRERLASRSIPAIPPERSEARPRPRRRRSTASRSRPDDPEPPPPPLGGIPRLRIEVPVEGDAVAYLFCVDESQERRLLLDLRTRDVMGDIWTACRGLREMLDDEGGA